MFEVRKPMSGREGDQARYWRRCSSILPAFEARCSTSVAARARLRSAIAQHEAVSKIVGLDLSEAFLAYARSKSNDPRIHFEQGDAQALPYPHGSFDCCMGLHVMSFIPDASKAASEMRRVTRPGGVVATDYH